MAQPNREPPRLNNRPGSVAMAGREGTAITILTPESRNDTCGALRGSKCSECGSPVLDEDPPGTWTSPWTSHPPHEVDHSMERPGFSVDFDVPGPHSVSWTSALDTITPTL